MLQLGFDFEHATLEVFAHDVSRIFGYFPCRFFTLGSGLGGLD